MTRVALIGAGVVGSSWSLVFARAGFEVVVYDADPNSAARTKDFVRKALSDLAALGLPSTEDAETIAARVKPAARMEEALDGVSYVQESAPERVEIKIELYKSLDRIAPPEIDSRELDVRPAGFRLHGGARASRALPCRASDQSATSHPAWSRSCRRPGPTTTLCERATALMREVGQSPIQLRREVNGFVVNGFRARC